MGRRKKVLTKEQNDFRNSILRGKVRGLSKSDPPVQPILTDEEKIMQHFFYINNCVYWINEYIDGRRDKNRLLETAIALQGNAKKLEETIKNSLNQ